MSNNLGKVKSGDVFSETSHYIFKGKVQGSQNNFLHVESNSPVSLSDSYVEKLLISGDQFIEVKEVGKEDKKDGSEQGIRSIWESINGKDSFTVAFRKQDKPLSQKKFNELRNKQINDAIAEIEKAAKNKKGVANKAKEVMADMQDNPVLDYEPGETRVLRGYKIQFSSRDGHYKCVDMDLLDGSGDDNTAIRPVNINTLKYLIYRGVKYIVK